MCMYEWLWYSSIRDVSVVSRLRASRSTAPRLGPHARHRLPMWSPLPLVVLVLLAILDGVRLTVGDTLLKPTPQQLKYADQELGAL